MIINSSLTSGLNRHRWFPRIKIHSSLARVEKAPYLILNIGIADDKNGNRSKIKMIMVSKTHPNHNTTFPKNE